MSKIMVTGVNGFVGEHLARSLRDEGHEVIGVGTGDVSEDAKPLVSSYYACDLTDDLQVSKLPLEDVEAVINLAALANVGESFSDPERYKTVNVNILTTLGNQMIKRSPQSRLVVVSTGAVYHPHQPMPLTEESKILQDGSPYAISKHLSELAAVRLGKKGLNYVIARPFNHSGPRQNDGFLIPDLYRKVVNFAKTNESIPVSPRETKRDYTDVRDIVRAYSFLALSNKLQYDTYNICSGTSRTNKEVLNTIIETLDLHGKIATHEDPSLLRPTDPADLYGDCTRIKNDTGWSPTIPFETTIGDFIKSRQT